MEDRFTVLSGPALLGILITVAMLGFLLVVLWVAFDTATEYNPAYGGATVQWAGR